jgi:cytidyltransferase-like protein
MKKINKEVVVVVSGGFDPLHVGHVRMFEEAKRLGDRLVVVLNNEQWLKKKKGSSFMPEAERKEIIEALRCVDEVVLTTHASDPADMSVCAELRNIRPDIFANGGDRKVDNVPEVAVCEEIGCRMVFAVGRGGKMQSSSWLLAKHAENAAAGNKKEE